MLIKIVIYDGTIVSKSRTDGMWATIEFQRQTQILQQDGCDSMKNIQGYKAIDIAKYIIMYCTQREVTVSNIKLQKILYFVYGVYLVRTGSPLFEDEFRAWQYGPVVEAVYNEFCIFGGSYICLQQQANLNLSDSIKSIIDPIIEDRMRQDVFNLVDETHLPDSAWDKAVKRENGIGCHPQLFIEDIKKEFMDKDVNVSADDTKV